MVSGLIGVTRRSVIELAAELVDERLLARVGFAQLGSSPGPKHRLLSHVLRPPI